MLHTLGGSEDTTWYISMELNFINLGFLCDSQGLYNIIQLDFDYKKEFIYWVDSTRPSGRKINRMRLNGSDLKVHDTLTAITMCHMVLSGNSLAYLLSYSHFDMHLLSASVKFHKKGLCSFFFVFLNCFIS